MMHVGTEIDESLTGPFDTITCAEQVIRCTEIRLRGELQRLLLRFTQTLILQTAHIAIGARYDSIEQQLCGFLLMTLDRLPTNELHITHQQVSVMLGVRRETITDLSQKL